MSMCPDLISMVDPELGEIERALEIQLKKIE